MKILIPVDFSAASRQALRYACYLSENTDAQLEVLHVFDIPILSADAYVFVPPQEEIESIKKNHIIHLHQFLEQDTQIQSEKLNINYNCIYGNSSEQILEFSIEKHADLIIMGIQGKCVRPNFFMGSTFIHIMNHSNIPVIGLHASTTSFELKHILFTYDLKDFANKSLLRPIVQFAKYFKAHIYILNVSEDISDFPMLSQKLLENEMDPSLLNYDISFHVIKNKDIIEGIKEFLKSQPVELVCFIHREHDILYNIFKESTSRKAAFQIDLPLMSIHT